MGATYLTASRVSEVEPTIREATVNNTGAYSTKRRILCQFGAIKDENTR